MVSNKYRPGQKVWWDHDSWGIVMGRAEAAERDLEVTRRHGDTLRVWAHWDRDAHVGWVPECIIIDAGKGPIKRNLPDWF